MQIKKNSIFRTQKTNETPEGFLDLTGYISEADKVMEYINWWDESISKEVIPLSELENVTSQAKGLILTDGHPWCFLDAKNAKEHIRGFVTEVHGIEDKKLKVNLRIIDMELINDIRSGKKTEFSIGYSCDMLEEPGTTENGEIYNSKQTNILLNHVALVENGRAGEEVGVITLNSIETKNISSEKGLYKINKKDVEVNMATVKYNGKEYDENGLLVELSVRDKELTTKTNENDTLKGQIAALEQTNRELTEKVNGFDNILETTVSERLNQISEVSELTGETTENLVKLNSVDLKKKVINTAFENINLENKSEGYIDGMYAGAVAKLNSIKPTTVTSAPTEKKNTAGKTGFERLNDAVNKIGGKK